MKTRQLPPKRNAWRVFNDRSSLYRGLVILLVIILVLFLMGFIFIPVSIVKGVPFSLHSSLLADYSAEIKSGRIAPFNIGLMVDALRDQGTPVAWQQIATIQADLLTPVPSVTPLFDPGWTSTPIGLTPTEIDATHRPSLTPASTWNVSSTPSQGTATATLSPNITVSIDPTLTLQVTPNSTSPITTASTSIPHLTPTRTVQPTATTVVIILSPSPTRTWIITVLPGTKTPTSIIQPTRTKTPTWTPTMPAPPTRTFTPSPSPTDRPTPTRTPTTPPPPTRTPTSPPPPTKTPEPYPPPYP